MFSWSQKTVTKPIPRWLTVTGTIEGYLSAVLTVAALLLPVSPGNEQRAMYAVIALIGLGLGFGVGGVRFGAGGGRIAAWLGVVVLGLLALALVAKGVWDRFATISAWK